MIQIKKIKVIMVSVILGVLVMGVWSSPLLGQQKTLKIGVIGPMTGPNARVGTAIMHATQMAFEEINYQIGDYKIKLVPIDSESDPEKGVRAYTKAVLQEGIQATLNNWHSSVAVAMMDVAARYKIPHFFGGAATKVIIDKYEKNPEKYQYWEVGKFWPVPSKLTKAYVETIKEAIKKGLWDPDAKKVSVFGENTDWGRSFGKAIAEDFREAGWEVVTEDYFPMEETDFYPLLTKVKKAGATVLAGTHTTPASYASLIKQAREVGLKSLIIADGLGWMGEWYELTGEASNYVLDQIPQWTTDEAKAFRDRFEKKWGVKPSASSAGLMYDGAGFLIKILRKTYELYGELNSKTIHKVAHELVRTGKLTYTEGILMKEYKYTPETVPDPVVDKDHFIYPVIQYFEGEGTVVWPEEWAEADLQIPEYLK